MYSSGCVASARRKPKHGTSKAISVNASHGTSVSLLAAAALQSGRCAFKGALKASLQQGKIHP
jgi:hypothetical protein